MTGDRIIHEVVPALLVGLLGAICLVLQSDAGGQLIPLTSVRPNRATSYFPGQDPTPRETSVSPDAQSLPQRAVSLRTESEISYPVPTGQKWFSGMLVYQPSAIEVPEGEPTFYVPVAVRIMADGNTVLEQGMTGMSPPFRFSVPVAGASEVTISSRAQFVGGEVSLAEATFGPARAEQAGIYVPAPGAGFVDCASNPRQELLRFFHPEEDVAVNVSYGGSAQQADIAITLIPEFDNRQPVSAALRVPLHPMPGGLAEGVGNWRVPAILGPAKLHIQETIAGKTVFAREYRIAVGAAVNLDNVSDNNFGIHTATSGYPLINDEFAGLWGAKWARIYLRWSLIENRKGTYDFSRADALLAIYRNQHMRILAVVGEDAPAWAGLPSPEYFLAWKQFVAAVAGHLSGKVDAWDIFNEVDVKYYGSLEKGAPKDWDITALRIANEAMRDLDPHGVRVCCSTGTTMWLPYDKRLLDASVLSQADAVSLHPYQPGPPEERDGPFNYIERLGALRELLQERGLQKPLWATEANWIIGPVNSPNITSAAGTTERQQAEYVVRVNLLSAAAGVKYFLHSPFSHRLRPQPHMTTWAAYAEMAALFGSATHVSFLSSGPGVFGVTASPGNHQVGALWSAGGNATVRLTGGRYAFRDLFGNSVAADPNNLRLSEAPLYFEGGLSRPDLQVLQDIPASQWESTPHMALWTCVKGSTCIPVRNGIHVSAPAKKYAYEVVSPTFSVRPGTCYRVRLQIVLERGVVGVFALDGATSKRIGRVVYDPAIRSDRAYMNELQFTTDPQTESLKLVVSNASLEDIASSATVLDPQIAECR